jgi:hypothetical protein
VTLSERHEGQFVIYSFAFFILNESIHVSSTRPFGLHLALPAFATRYASEFIPLHIHNSCFGEISVLEK